MRYVIVRLLFFRFDECYAWDTSVFYLFTLQNAAKRFVYLHTFRVVSFVRKQRSLRTDWIERIGRHMFLYEVTVAAVVWMSTMATATTATATSVIQSNKWSTDICKASVYSRVPLTLWALSAIRAISSFAFARSHRFVSVTHRHRDSRYFVFAKSSSRAFSVSIVYFHWRDVLFMIRCTFLCSAAEKYWLAESLLTATVDCGKSFNYVVIYLIITLLTSLYEVSCVLTTYAHAHCHKDFIQSAQICCNHEIDECKLKMMIDANTRYHLHVFQQRHTLLMPPCTKQLNLESSPVTGIFQTPNETIF